MLKTEWGELPHRAAGAGATVRHLRQSLTPAERKMAGAGVPAPRKGAQNPGETPGPELSRVRGP